MNLVTPADCCSPCPTPVTVNIPGVQGAAGADGGDGANGKNAYSQLVDGFAMPAYGADTASLEATSSEWMVIGQIVRVQVAGDMRVVSKADATHVVLRNIATATLYPDNAAPAAVIAPSMYVSPSGLQGAAGAAGSTVVFPTTTKGDLMVDDGANNPASNVLRMAAGTDGQVVAYDSAVATGVTKVTIAPNTATDNAIARFNGTAAKPVPIQDSAMLVTDDGDLQISTGNAKGANATDLQSQRAAAAQVASGARAAIGGGLSNKASGADSAIPGGTLNEASAPKSACLGGSGNIASAQGAATIGGEGNVASGQDAIASGSGSGAGGNYSVATGQFAYTNAHGQRAHAAGRFASTGDVETLDALMRNQTAGATPTELFLDGAATRFGIGGAVESWLITGTVNGLRDNGDTASWKFEGQLTYIAGNAVLVAAITPSLIAASAGCAASWGQAANVAVTADNVNKALKIAVTGTAANNIRWQAHVTLNAVGWW